MSKAVEQVEASWAALLEVLDGIPEERMSEPGVTGDWSVKDLLGHIAFWDGRAIGTIEREMSGEPYQGDASEVDDINAQVYAERASWDLPRMMDEFHGTHERLMSALRLLPDIDPSMIAGDTFEHYDDHAAALRAWRERAGL